MANLKVNIMGVRVQMSNISGIMGLVAGVIIISVVAAMSFWTDGNIEWLISTFANRTVDVPLWLSVILTLLLNALVLVFNIIVEILKYTM